MNLRTFSSRGAQTLRKSIVSIPRPWKRAIQIFIDVVMLMSVVYIAYSIRFQTIYVPNPTQWLMICLAPITAIPIFIKFGLYRAVLRYLPDRAIWTILHTVTLSTMLWIAAAFILQATGAEGVPRSIPVLYWVGAVFAMAASRFGARWFLFGAVAKVAAPAKRVTTLVIGSGQAAIQLVGALRGVSGRQVVGILTADASLYGSDLAGIRVGAISTLGEKVANYGVDEVILTPDADLGSAQRRDIIAYLASRRVRVRMLPSLGDIVAGKYIVSQVRDIDVADLLGREPVKPDLSIMREAVEAKTVLVTGAAGSIGSALALAIAQNNPKQLIFLDINEHGIFQLQNRVARLFGIMPESVLGSVTDPTLLERAFKTYDIDTVYHCAAYKHVAFAEKNVVEYIKTNVFGTLGIVDAATKAGVKSFVLISTDKAVRPAGVMGATKRWAELVVRYYSSQRQDETDGCKYAIVRFGNVLGSSGSVVPLFKEQIAMGGPVTLRDDNMTRYFMSIDEAANLILQAGVLAESGDIMVLEMGNPVRIRDLAEQMILLAGLTVYKDGEGDIEIVTTGAQDGEKLHEELFYDLSSVSPTRNPRILRPKPIDGIVDQVPRMLEQMEDLLAQNDPQAAKQLLFGALGLMGKETH